MHFIAIGMSRNLHFAYEDSQSESSPAHTRICLKPNSVVIVKAEKDVKKQLRLVSYKRFDTFRSHYDIYIYIYISDID